MKKIILICTLIFSFNNILAQNGYGNISEINDAKNRTLLVMYANINKEVYNKLKKENIEKADEYEEYINEFNENFKNVVTKYWKMNSKIEFINEIEVAELLKTQPKKYVLLRCPTFVQVGNPSDYKYTKHSNFEFCIEKTKSYRATYLEYQLLNEVDGRGFTDHPIYQFNFANVNPNLSDFILGVTFLQSYFNKRLGSKKSELAANNLKDKILVLRKEDIDPKLKIEDIAKYYPYKFELVSNEEYCKSIETQVKNRVYFNNYMIDMDELECIGGYIKYNNNNKINKSVLSLLKNPKF